MQIKIRPHDPSTSWGIESVLVEVPPGEASTCSEFRWDLDGPDALVKAGRDCTGTGRNFIRRTVHRHNGEMDDSGGAVDALAGEMFVQAMREGQSARRVDSSTRATNVRQALRKQGRTEGVRLRTAWIDDVVVVARLDADIWNDTAETMRTKLIPPG